METTWYQLILDSIVCIIVFIILCLRIYCLYMNGFGDKRGLCSNIYSVCGIFSFFLASLCLTSLTSLSFYSVSHMDFHMDKSVFTHIILYRGGWTTWSLGTSFCYLCLIHRLVVVFKETQFKISTTQYRIFYSLIFAFFALESCSSACYILYFYDQITLKNYEIYHLVIMVFQTSFDLILTICLIHLFTKRLNAVLIGMSDQHSHKLAVQRRKLINIIAKYNVLGIPSIVSTQIFLLLDFIFIIIVLITESKHFEEIADTRLLPFVWIIECLINVFCLFFNSHDTEIWYYRLCGKCHQYSKKRQAEKRKRSVHIGMTDLKSDYQQLMD